MTVITTTNDQDTSVRAGANSIALTPDQLTVIRGTVTVTPPVITPPYSGSFPWVGTDGTKLSVGPGVSVFDGMPHNTSIGNGQTVVIAFTMPASGHFQLSFFGTVGGDRVPRSVWLSKTPGYTDWAADRRGTLTASPGLHPQAQIAAGNQQVVINGVVDDLSGIEFGRGLMKLHVRSGETWYAMVQSRRNSKEFEPGTTFLTYNGAVQNI